MFDTKKNWYIDDDDDDKEYKGIRDLEYMFNEVNENDEDYYKPEIVGDAFKGNYRVYESRGSQYYESLEECLIKIRSYLENMIREYVSTGEWKLQLTVSIKFISSRNPEQFRIGYSYSENIEIMRGTDINNAVNNLLIGLKGNYINDLSRMEGSKYHFEKVALLEYKFHKISLRRAGSYIDSPKWIKNKKATINPQNKDNSCFNYALVAALNHHKIDNHPERVSNLRRYIKDYNWSDICYPLD